MATKPLVQNISCHAFNKDGSLIALCPNSNEVHIYATNGSDDYTKWVKKYVLDEHAGFVSAMDWSHATNSLVTCSHDRNAYVWTYEAKTDAWKPVLVVLRINRAATCVKWSPSGNKFAVASGAKQIPVCHYEDANKWWIAKIIKNHKSTVLSVDWCPNSKFVVSGSSDFKCRVFSAYIKDLDSPEDDGFGALWADQHKFGEVLAEFDQARSWVQSVAWSPDGFKVAFSAQNSTVSFVQFLVGAAPKVQTVYMKALPLVNIRFTGDNTLIGVGWDPNPAVFKATGSGASIEWKQAESLDKEQEVKADAPKGAFGSALKAFGDSASKGVAVGAPAKGGGDTILKTRHQNTVLCTWINKPGLMTTSGVDGRVLYWDISKV